VGYEKLFAYHTKVMNEELDFVNLHTIFLYNKNDIARLGSQLFCERGIDSRSYCVDKSVKMWMAKGLCPQKIVMGEWRGSTKD